MATQLLPHEEQQFHFLLLTAVERYTERLEQRCLGPTAALKRLREEPEGEGIRLTQFASAIFQDFLLDNLAGACFVLQALGTQPVPETPKAGKIADQLGNMALAAFSTALRAKTEESLERNAVFEGDSMGVKR